MVIAGRLCIATLDFDVSSPEGGRFNAPAQGGMGKSSGVGGA